MTYAAEEMTAGGFVGAQAARTPGATAIADDREAISYRQLDERSNRLAHYLRLRGVQTDTLVPICMERSTDMIVGILGILKAGGAYVPIDPDYPKERIAYMLNDTNCKVCLAEDVLKDQLSDLIDNPIEVVDMRKEWEVIAGTFSGDKEGINYSSPWCPGYILWASSSAKNAK